MIYFFIYDSLGKNMEENKTFSSFIFSFCYIYDI